MGSMAKPSGRCKLSPRLGQVFYQDRFNRPAREKSAARFWPGLSRMENLHHPIRHHPDKLTRICLLSVCLLGPFGCGLGHLFGWNIFLMRGYRPKMPKWIEEFSVSISPKHVGGRH